MGNGIRSEATDDAAPPHKDENGNESSTGEFDSISSFYRDTTVFITGVTGFLGHVLLCKLLSSCPDIRLIYILVRGKRNETASERYAKIFNESTFDKLKSEQPELLQKVKIVEGDCGTPNLGISKEEREMLMSEVNVIFHVAATVKFDAPLRTAVNINVRSTRDLLEMAENTTNLKAFVYVSTAYAFCAGRQIIEEKPYAPPLEPNSLIEVANMFDEDVIDRITPALLQDNENTYVFTKATSEGLFASKNLPVAIFRPGIVTSTAKEPVPGWTSNLYGPTGIVLAGGMGMLRSLHADSDCRANIVPCDYVTNALVASAWYTAKKWRREEKRQTDTIPILNYTSTQTKKVLTWGQFLHQCNDVLTKVPFSEALWLSYFTLTKYAFLDNVYAVMLHQVPAHILDTVGAICGKKSKLLRSFADKVRFLNGFGCSPKDRFFGSMVKTYEKIRKLTSAISYFAIHDWTFPNEQVQRMWNMLSDEDKRNFNFDLETIDWKEYFDNYVIGVRQYLVKEKPDTIPKAIEKRRKLYFLHYAVVFVLVCFVFFCLNFVCNCLFSN